MPNRSVFFVSDGTGLAAETFGNSILAQTPIGGIRTEAEDPEAIRCLMIRPEDIEVVELDFDPLAERHRDELDAGSGNAGAEQDDRAEQQRGGLRDGSFHRGIPPYDDQRIHSAADRIAKRIIRFMSGVE